MTQPDDVVLERFEEPDEAFHIPALPHDSRVVGDEPYVSLNLVGAEHVAAE